MRIADAPSGRITLLEASKIPTRDTWPPLFYPFAADALRAPPESARGLYLGAVPALPIPPALRCGWTLVQGFRPDYLKLRDSGAHVLPAAEGDGYDLALGLAGRHRGENEARLAEAARRVRDGGLIVMAGGRTDGIASLRKRLPENVPVAGHLSKNHGEVFWIYASPKIAEHLAGLDAGRREALPLVEGRFRAAPGMFSHDRVDLGSRLLAGHLPADLAGEAADFCAGWGYLSVRLAEAAPGIGAIDLYEADHASLDAARLNLAGSGKARDFFWQDLAAEPVGRRYDAIVMNPPFHQGRAADPGIGTALIAAASRALKPGGELFMVANRQLPYEETLRRGFSKVWKLAEEAGFKVFRARR
ncbi:MAG: class I SAM-dependent methyltransferase [Rhizobiales bacterium]|nr:class I SAM-dependent methyltransferase [Hyphomicrobiales bacterium]